MRRGLKDIKVLREETLLLLQVMLIGKGLYQRGENLIKFIARECNLKLKSSKK